MQFSHEEVGNQTEAVTARLRQMIIEGTFSQGERLTEMSVATRLQVSRTPVRLALATLAKEDLVEGAPNRGFRVRRITIDDIRQILEVRATLEGMAARLVAEKGLTERQEEFLKECLSVGLALADADCGDAVTIEAFAKMNGRFHTSIAEFSGNGALQKMLRQNPFRTGPLLHLLSPEEGREVLAESYRDHLRLVEAMCNGEGTRAEFLMREHGLLPLRRADRLFVHIHANAQSDRTDDAA